MNILIDIGHPAHVHYFKNLYHELKIKHKVIVTCKSVEIIKNLLAYNDIPFLELGEKGVGVMNKIKKQIGFTRTIVDITKKESIDLCIGVSATIIHAAKLAKINAILFDDDDLDAQFFVKHYFFNGVALPNETQKKASWQDIITDIPTIFNMKMKGIFTKAEKRKNIHAVFNMSDPLPFLMQLIHLPYIFKTRR